MNKKLTILLFGTIVIASSGCASKSYVREQIAPLNSKLSDMDQRMAQNTASIHDVDARMHEGMEQANSNNQQISQKLDSTSNQAQEAKQLAGTCEAKTSALVSTVSNLNNYHVVGQTLLQFGVNQSDLNGDAKQALDQLGDSMSPNNSYIVVVQGGTDNSGNEEYNYDLSQRRANEVVRYLVAKHNVPPYKMYALGIGEDKPLAGNDTPDGRKKNRRAEVQLMSNAGQPTSKDDESDSGNQVGRLTAHPQ
jgi:OmpA-OmpF porin, OOP family